MCLGIDPRPTQHPSTNPANHDGDPAQVARAVVNYFRAILEETEDLIACVKLQIAFFEGMGVSGHIALAQLLADCRSLGIPTILDAKRGDIGSTAEAYAGAYLADGVFSSDALTVNPYLGFDSLDPFVSSAVSKAEHRNWPRVRSPKSLQKLGPYCLKVFCLYLDSVLKEQAQKLFQLLLCLGVKELSSMLVDL